MIKFGEWLLIESNILSPLALELVQYKLDVADSSLDPEFNDEETIDKWKEIKRQCEEVLRLKTLESLKHNKLVIDGLLTWIEDNEKDIISDSKRKGKFRKEVDSNEIKNLRALKKELKSIGY